MEKKNGCIPWIIILVVLAIIGGIFGKGSDSDSDSMTRKERKEDKIAFKAYEEVIRYALYHKTKEESYSYMRLGVIGLEGEAVFRHNFKEKSISVTYYLEKHRVTGEYHTHATEKGLLSKMSIKESCGLRDADNYYPVSISGRWQPHGTGGGDMIITVSKDNVLEVIIFGDNHFLYQTRYFVESADYLLEVFNEARKSIAKLNNTEISPILSISKSSPIKSVQQSAERLTSEDSGKNMGVSGRYSIASDRLLTETDIEGCSKKDIRLMRNAIFARHGYIFKNKELADYFSTMDWYEPRYSDVTSKLTEIELKNIEFLKKHE